MKSLRSQYSQHFLINRQLVAHLVRQASLGPNDTVVEIGPGRGIITRELLKVCHTVIAIEIDPSLSRNLATQLINRQNLTLCTTDFLRFPLPVTPYKVFANLPFAIEGEIIRRLLESDNPPDDMHLVVIRDVGFRWVGHRKESYFSLSYKPWFEMKVTHQFRRTDFTPKPKVDSIVITISKRPTPMLKITQKKSYEQFLTQAFSGGRRIDTNLRPFFSKNQLNHLSRTFNFPFNARPTDLSFHQWLQLFKEQNWCSGATSKR